MINKDKDIHTVPIPKLARQLTSQFDLSQDHQDDQLITSTSTFLEEEESLSAAKTPVLIDIGTATNIGGGHVNQDKFMSFRSGSRNEHVVMAVFDGHGRELGELAAQSALDFMQTQLRDPELMRLIEHGDGDAVQKVFTDLFHGAHLAVKQSFRAACEETLEEGWEVAEDPLGFLVKRQVRDSDVLEMNVHGGTTATVIVIIDSKRLICANVGDSSAIFGCMRNDDVDVKELSAEHSPESMAEFQRVKQRAPKSSSLLQNDIDTLRFVYDGEAQDLPKPKYFCPPIFELDHASGICSKTSLVGTYYKNVRSEWATLVSAPPNAKFQDALAFTRSLGDLHLHVYGVCHTPEVHEYDLHSLLQGQSQSDTSFLFLCTDGVWDNWRHEDLVRKTFALHNKSRTMQQLTEYLMDENLALAQKYFGSQADNMTAVLCAFSTNKIDEK